MTAGTRPRDDNRESTVDPERPNEQRPNDEVPTSRREGNTRTRRRDNDNDEERKDRRGS